MKLTWNNWTKFTAVVIFLMTVLGFYFTYSAYFNPNASLEFRDFPSETDLDTLALDENIEFSFFLYNKGEGPAIVQRVILYNEENSLIEPEKDFSIEAKGTQEVKVTLYSYGEEKSDSIYVEVFYDDDEKIVSQEVPISWGSLL